MTTEFHPPRHIVWSTNSVDLSDPFQRRWYLRQVLTHGRSDDIARVDLSELRQELDALHLPPAVHALWARFFARHAAR
jgi:hypothetical protein